MPVAKCLRSAVRSVFDQDSLSIESATADILRKYSTVSHQYDFTMAEALLNARRNQLLWTEDFTNAVWAKPLASVTSSNNLSPDGTNTASLITASGATTFTQTITAKSTSVTYTIYAKQSSSPTTARTFGVRNGTTATNLLFINVDYSTGQFTYSAGSTGAVVTADNNGYWKIQLTVTSGLSLGDSLVIYAMFSGTSSANDAAYIWHPQVEWGTSATTYQKITDWNTEFLALFPSHQLFQDAAGTIPVTGVEQPIGKILDNAGTAHATQATSTKRPTLSAKYNLLLNSYSFNNISYWTLSTGGVGSLPVVTPNAALNPFGTATDASLIVFNINGGTTSADLSQINSTSISFTTGVQYVGSIWARTSDGSTVVMKLVNPDATIFQSITITPVWTRHVITTTASLTTTGTFRLRLRGNESTSSSASVYVYAADLRTPASTPTTVPLYQHTTSATVYDTSGFPTYAKFDGVDDALVTSSIDFTGADSVAHFTGIAKLSDAAAGIVYEFSADVNTNNGSFHVSAPVAASASIGVSSKGTTLVSASNTGFASPYISALSSSMDISTPLAQVIVNNSTTISSSSSQGTGNYGNYALYIGSRGGTSVPFNGRISTITLIGATITSPETRILETFTNNKLGKVY